MKLDLTKRQLSILKKGGNVNVKSHQIGVGFEIALAPDMTKRLERARLNGTGSKISGGSIDVLKDLGVKKDAKSLVRKTNTFMADHHLPSLATDARVASEIALDYLPGISYIPRPIKREIAEEIGKVA